MKLKVKKRDIRGSIRLPCIASEHSSPDEFLIEASGIKFPGGKVQANANMHSLLLALSHFHATAIVKIALGDTSWNTDTSPGDDVEEIPDEDVVIIQEKKGTMELLVTFLPAFFSATDASRHALVLLSFISPILPSFSPASSPATSFDHIPLLHPPSPSSCSSKKDIRDADEVFAMVRTSSWTDEISQPEGLKAKLFHYQARAVSWMCYREEGKLLTKKRRDQEEGNHATSSSSAAVFHPPPCFRDELVLQSVIWRRAAISSVGEDGGSVRHQDIFYHILENRVYLDPPPAPNPSIVVRGGLLCEEMGLGKTIESIALILSLMDKKQTRGERAGGGSDKLRGPTLIVVPPTILGQWEAEFKKHCKDGALSVITYRGLKFDQQNEADKVVDKQQQKSLAQKRKREIDQGAVPPSKSKALEPQGKAKPQKKVMDVEEWKAQRMKEIYPELEAMNAPPAEDTLEVATKVARWLCSCDVVLATTSVLRSEVHYSIEKNTGRSLRGGKRFPVPDSPLIQIHWHRVMIDEAQMVGGGTSAVATMASRLSSRARWCITGTPIGSNGLEDVSSLMSSLQAKPFDDGRFFKMMVSSPYISRPETTSNSQPMATTLSRLLGCIMWRSSKADKAVQREIKLPGRRLEKAYLRLSAPEQTMMENIEERARVARVDQPVAQLLQLRLACLHPQLTTYWREMQVNLSDGVLSLSSLMNRMKGQAATKLQAEERDLCLILNALGRIRLKASDAALGRSSTEAAAHGLETILGILQESYSIAENGVKAADDGEEGKEKMMKESADPAAAGDVLEDEEASEQPEAIIIASADSSIKRWRLVQAEVCSLIARVLRGQGRIEEAVAKEAEVGEKLRDVSETASLHLIKAKEKMQDAEKRSLAIMGSIPHCFVTLVSLATEDGSTSPSVLLGSLISAGSSGDAEAIEWIRRIKEGLAQAKAVDEKKRYDANAKREMIMMNASGEDALGHGHGQTSHETLKAEEVAKFCSSSSPLRKACEVRRDLAEAILFTRILKSDLPRFSEVESLAGQFGSLSIGLAEKESYLAKLTAIEDHLGPADEVSKGWRGSIKLDLAIMRETLGLEKIDVQVERNRHLAALKRIKRSVRSRLEHYDGIIEKSNNETVEQLSSRSDDVLKAVLTSSQSQIDLFKALKQRELCALSVEAKAFNASMIDEESKVWAEGKAPLQLELVSRGETWLLAERVNLKASCIELAKKVVFLKNQIEELAPLPTLPTVKEEGKNAGQKGREELERDEQVASASSAEARPPLSSPVEVVDLMDEDPAPKRTQLEVEMAMYEDQGGTKDAAAGPCTSSAILAPAPPQSECPICSSTLSGIDLILFPCAHYICERCTRRVFVSNRSAPCPICRRVSDSKELVKTKLTVQEAQPSLIYPTAGSKARNDGYGEIDPPEGPSLLSIPPPPFSFLTKIDALVRRIAWLKIHHPDEKTLVFSQWKDALGLVSKALTKSGIKHTSLSGAGGARGGLQAKQALDSFNEDEECKVMLLSLQTQAAGLTLVRASRVILLEPSLDPSIEQQAVARVHRVGQEREAIVTRLIIEGTIEEKVLKMLEAKQRLLGGAAPSVLEEAEGRELDGEEMPLPISSKAPAQRSEVVNEGDARGLLASLLDEIIIEDA